MGRVRRAIPQLGGGGKEGPEPERPPGSRSLRERAELDILDATVRGDPPPDDRDPCGVVADALLGDDAFAGVLKLEEHERRLWAALQSTLRSLERRQRPPRDALRRDAEAPDPQPAPADAPMAQSGTSQPPASEPPARNEPNSGEGEAPVPAAPPPSQVPHDEEDATLSPLPEVTHEVTDDVTAPAALPGTPVVLAPPGPSGEGPPSDPGGASTTGVRAKRGEAGYDRPSP